LANFAKINTIMALRYRVPKEGWVLSTQLEGKDNDIVAIMEASSGNLATVQKGLNSTAF
jgi:hypothetical protein